ncbi:hypothetical protein CU098_009919 [Rhizopus stolonifer]|uniref:Uncharacterized protein n=1 Tax=Rhizopus stolonifer TaxID=4846 RepID=A0A367KJE7_RHIST|nr:hypothetical protein CU098_009919 [Rhizopus stolonifer]
MKPYVLVSSFWLCVYALEPTTMALEPKTIHFSSTTGGLSHIAWVLEIGQVLAERGHNVSFLTTDMYTKFGLSYAPHIKTISLGPHLSKVQFRDLFDTQETVSTRVTLAYKTMVQDTYKRDFMAYTDIFTNSNTSLVVCDQMALPCFDAAKALNIPMIIYMTMSLSEDTKAPFISSNHISSQPTTLDQSFTERLYDRYVMTPKFVYRYLPVARAIRKARQELNIPDFDPLARHSNVIKMVNSFWGMDSPRPVGPLVEYVGPIINAVYDSLTQDLSDFMDNHKRIVYVAFGQMYTPSKEEFQVLLTSLVEAYEYNFLDGFIWSLSLKARHDLPEQVTTSSGKVYRVQDLFHHHMDLRFEPWSPQFAILQHEHCKLFISHGGSSSVHESLYNGVPLLLHPFTSDQPSNAHNIANAGVGLVLDRKSHNLTDTLEKLSSILQDKDGQFASNMKSMQALVQIRSRKKRYAADMIEEVLYSVRNKDDIWHRRQVDATMSWLKATNWDVDLFAFVSVIVVYQIIAHACAFFKLVFVPPMKWKTE